MDTDVPNDMITVPLDENRSENLDPGQPPTPNIENAENGQIRPHDMTKENQQNTPNSDTPTNFEPEPMDISPSSSGGDTTVPSVSDLANQETEGMECEEIEENFSPRGRKYNLRPNPNPNYSEDFRY